LFCSLLTAKADTAISSSIDRNELNLGDVVRVCFTITDSNIKSFDFPNMTNDYQVIGRSSSTSIQIINGVRSDKKIFEFIIQPLHPGNITIPGANATDGANNFATAPINILVHGAANRVANNSATNHQANNNVAENSSEIFAKLSVDNPNLFVNQKSTLRVKVYHRGNLKGLHIPPVKLDDFVQKRNDKAKEYKESVNGKEYLVYEISYVIYPAKAGSLYIPKYKLEGTIIQESPMARMDPFMAFFGGFYEEKEIKLQTNSLTINAKSMNGKEPQGFSGYIGKLNVSHKIDKTEINSGDAVIITTIISGDGEANSIDEELIEESEDYTAFKDKGKENIGLASFSKVLNYTVLPGEGLEKVTIRIKPIVIFDPATREYKTIGEKSFEVSIKNVVKKDEKAKKQERKKHKKLLKSKDYVINYKLIYKILSWIGIAIAILIGFGIIYWLIKFYRANRKIWTYTKSISDANSIPEISLLIKDIYGLKNNLLSAEQKIKIDNFLEMTDKYNYGLAGKLAVKEIRKTALEIDRELKNL